MSALGSAAGTLGAAIRRKRVDEELRASEAELRAVFGAMNDIVLVLDGEGRYLKVAPTTSSMLYRSPEELVGRTVHDTFPPEQADTILGGIRHSLKAQERVDIEYGLRVLGQDMWFSATFSPMTQDTVVAVARVITEHAKMWRLLEGRVATLSRVAASRGARGQARDHGRDRSLRRAGNLSGDQGGRLPHRPGNPPQHGQARPREQREDQDEVCHRADNARDLRRRRRFRPTRGVPRPPRPAFDARAGAARGRNAGSTERARYGDPSPRRYPPLNSGSWGWYSRVPEASARDIRRTQEEQYMRLDQDLVDAALELLECRFPGEEGIAMAPSFRAPIMRPAKASARS